MADRPKPPDGCDSWLDAVLSETPGSYVIPQRWQAYAREELEELRNELVLFKATAKQEEAVHVHTTT